MSVSYIIRYESAARLDVSNVSNVPGQKFMMASNGIFVRTKLKWSCSWKIDMLER